MNHAERHHLLINTVSGSHNGCYTVENYLRLLAGDHAANEDNLSNWSPEAVVTFALLKKYLNKCVNWSDPELSFALQDYVPMLLKRVAKGGTERKHGLDVLNITIIDERYVSIMDLSQSKRLTALDMATRTKTDEIEEEATMFVIIDGVQLYLEARRLITIYNKILKGSHGQEQERQAPIASPANHAGPTVEASTADSVSAGQRRRSPELREFGGQGPG